jgi:hypothetical protein
MLSVRDFNTSRFSQLGDTSSGSISDILARAEAAVESQLKRPILPTVFSESYVSRGRTLYLRHRPILSLAFVGRRFLYGALPMAITGYVLNRETGIIVFDADFSGYTITIDYTAGFTEVPEDLKEAILMQAALFAYQDLEIYGSGDSKEPGIMYIKRDIKSLLEPYKQLHNAF